MKKFLLFAAGIALAATASAQTEVGFLDAVALDLESKPTLADNTLLAETANVTMTFLNGQEVSKQAPAFQGCKTVIVNGEEIALVDGIGGTANGTGTLDGPTGGCIYNFEVKADGWLLVPSKISSNKNFYVFEGKMGESPMPVAYTMGMDLKSKEYPLINKIVFTLPGDEYGYVNTAAADIDKYTFGTNTISWPIRIATGDAEASSAGNGTGVIAFPVYAEAGNYMVLATGSKMNTCGYIFVPCNPETTTPSVSLDAAEYEIEGNVYPAQIIEVLAGNGAGVSSVAADAADVNAPVYNVIGQRVSKDAKGLLIQNGRKFYNR